MRTALIVAACASALAAGSASANLLVNGSFEDAKDFVDNYGGDTMNLSVGSTTMRRWTVIGTTSGAGLAWIGPTNPYGLTAEKGSYFLDLTEENTSGPYGGVEQSFGTVAGDKYKVTFWLGSSSQWGVQDGLTASAAGASKTFTSINNGSQNNLWQHKTFDFTANSASTTLSLLGASGVNYIGLDNVSVTLVTAAAPKATPSVPELSTWAMLLTGFAGLGFAGSRAARKAAIPA
jgi:Protein of unknown function (DUF642)